MALKGSEIHWVVHNYIGVDGGYLGDFTYRSHREFYPGFCDLIVDPDALPGTTKDRFIRILSEAPSAHQAAILRGVSRRFPVDSEVQRTVSSHRQLLELAAKCADSVAVGQVDLNVSSDAVRRALADVAVLIERNGPTSAVDRLHTAMHGYMKALCATLPVQCSDDAGINALFKLVREHHPAFNEQGAHGETTTKFLRPLMGIMDAMNPARNWGSLAHPNEDLLGKDEAMLIVNASRTVFQYLNAKMSSA
ncbi:abortive infection family protein [Lysobacter sp. Root983]|uniref:abortive infection family protein n=1 Tax=Lysobacter sp. Root983 TaxID=1736613 RepID=UPI00071025D9|nr:abortive infection family protein [Lysobacter sp. Root983]KRD79732.1 hypothetical protein ASE43_02195 [Lysobacter sp. Root983]